jgi:hypothetical protein
MVVAASSWRIGPGSRQRRGWKLGDAPGFPTGPPKLLVLCIPGFHSNPLLLIQNEGY